MEIEFLHQTMVQHVTPAASQILTQIYGAISQAYSRKPGGAENLQQELDGVKKTLGETRRATAIDFLCFRPSKKDRDKVAGEKASDRDRERDSSGRSAGPRSAGDPGSARSATDPERSNRRGAEGGRTYRD